jgi:hypothetical protein
MPDTRKRSQGDDAAEDNRSNGLLRPMLAEHVTGPRGYVSRTARIVKRLEQADPATCPRFRFRNPSHKLKPSIQTAVSPEVPKLKASSFGTTELHARPPTRAQPGASACRTLNMQMSF